MRKIAVVLASVLIAPALLPPSPVSAATGVEAFQTAQETRLSVAHTPVRLVGDKIALSGLLEARNADGTWSPLADRPVEIYQYDYEKVATSRPDYQRLVTQTRTGADGRYRVTATVPSSGSWLPRFNGDRSDARYRLSEATTKILHVEYPTKVDGFAISPNPVGAGSKVTATGRLLRPHGTGSRAVVAGSDVTLQYSSDGRDWYNPVQAKTDSQGRFKLSATASKDGHWRVHFWGGPFGNATNYNQDATSSSAPKWIDVRYRTGFSSFNAAPEPVRKGRTLTVAGKLARDVSGWKPAGKGAKVTIYFQAKGSKTWKAVATTTTDSKGAFKKAFKASQDGTWKAVYAGSSSYLTSTSSTDYVDVR